MMQMVLPRMFDGCQRLILVVSNCFGDVFRGYRHGHYLKLPSRNCGVRQPLQFRRVTRAIADHVPASPDCSNDIICSKNSEFLSELTNEYVDDLDFWFVYSPVKVI